MRRDQRRIQDANVSSIHRTNVENLALNPWPFEASQILVAPAMAELG
jgi:hypothetical protein